MERVWLWPLSAAATSSRWSRRGSGRAEVREGRAGRQQWTSQKIVWGEAQERVTGAVRPSAGRPLRRAHRPPTKELGTPRYTHASSSTTQAAGSWFVCGDASSSSTPPFAWRNKNSAPPGLRLGRCFRWVSFISIPHTFNPDTGQTKPCNQPN